MYNHNKAQQSKNVCIFLGIYCMNSTLNSLPSLYQLIKIPCFQLDTESQYQQTPKQMFNARRCWHSVNTWIAAIIF